MRIYHTDGFIPEGAWIWVFGSNLAGRHGAGAALVARERFGALPGIGRGFSGNSFAIPTKDKDLRVLPLDLIRQYVNSFVEFTKTKKDSVFFVTRIGCGLAGYTNHEIAPMFKDCENCSMPEEWHPWV